MMDRSMIDAASGGALMDKTPAATRHLISNMASNTQQFGIKGATPSRMVNGVSLTSLVRQLVVGQHQPSIAVRVCGICTFVEHLIDMCPTLQEIESDHLESVGSIVEFEIPRTTILTIATTKSANIWQLTIFRGPNEAVGDKQPKDLAYYELQQHTISAKFKCHDLRPQNTGGSASKHCESATVG
ncbi:hypothetical protein CR513_29886, partial [Mucuna pruriens]